MKIAVIGTGMIGGTLAKLLVQAGHAVALTNSRGPETLKDTVAALGANAQALPTAVAVAWADWVALAVPLKAIQKLDSAPFAGKTVLDITNYYPDRDGDLDFGGRPSSAWVQNQLNGATVVKVFNTVWYKHLAEQADPGQPEDCRRAVFIAADDPIAKGQVADLVRELGFGPVYAGSLAESARLQPGSPVYNKVLSQLQGAHALEANA